MSREINNEAITVGDCIDLYNMKDTYTVIENGSVVEFVKEYIQ